MIEQKDIEQLKENLNDFIKRIVATKEFDYEADTKESIYLDYKELYKIYSTLEPTSIDKNFSSKEKTAINFLSLGLKNENEFDDLIMEFKNNAETSVLNVVDFIKSRSGFDLINKDSDFSKYSDEELVQIFGGLFGIQVTQDCVKSLRAEKIGRVVGYALSNLFNEHIVEFNKLKENDAGISFPNFLKEKIQSFDNECAYEYNENGKGKGLEIKCSINRGKNAKITQIRGRNRIDHCFVNDVEKTITFGQSTSNKDMEAQGYSFFKAYITLKGLVEEKTTNGEDNPYFGYKLNPYLMLGGRFVVDDNKNATQEKGRDFKKMLTNADKKDLETLAKMQYFRLYGNSANSTQANSLARFNVFIAGCDTLDLYEFSERMAILSSEQDKNNLCFKVVSSYLTNVCEILFKNDLSLKDGGKTDLMLLLNDVHAVTENIFINFKHQLTPQEYEESIKPLSNSIKNLKEKMEPIAGQFANKTLNNLRKLNTTLSTLESYNTENAKCIRAEFSSISWKEEKKAEILLNPSDLSFVTNIANKINDSMGRQGKKFFKRFLNTLEHKVKYGEELEDATLISSKSKFLKLYGYEDFGKFVKKASFIIDKKIGPEKYSEHATEFIEYLKADLLEKYPEISSYINEEVINKSRKPA